MTDIMVHNPVTRLAKKKKKKKNKPKYNNKKHKKQHKTQDLMTIHSMRRASIVVYN